jgi:hypothetical protein
MLSVVKVSALTLVPLIEKGVAGETVAVAGFMEEVMSRNLAFVGYAAL